MISIKKKFNKTFDKAPSAVCYWDKDLCAFVPQQNKDGSLPQYSNEQVREMLSLGSIVVGEDGLPKVNVASEMSAEDKQALNAAQYRRIVIQLIRKRYAADDELAILRQQEEKSQEYQEYYNYCEECKKQAHITVFGE